MVEMQFLDEIFFFFSHCLVKFTDHIITITQCRTKAVGGGGSKGSIDSVSWLYSHARSG